MKHVFTNDMAAHVWAQQTQDWGRGSSVSFQGDTFSSYQTPVARIVKPRRGGGKALLVTASDHSVTTSGHVSTVISAVAEWKRTFRVPSLGVSGGWHREDNVFSGKIDHKANLAYLTKGYYAEKARLKRAISRHYVSGLENDAEGIKIYCELFRLKYRIDFDTDRQEVNDHWAARDARNNSPAALAKKAKAKEQREAREARKLERERELQAENREKWLAGDPNVYFYSRDGSDYMRIKPGNPELVETNQRAVVRSSEARLAYKAVKNGVDNVGVGQFRVSRITDRGVHIGCHFFRWDTLDAFAEAQGWRAATPENLDRCSDPERVTCGNCERSWCERCDPAPSALCPWCNGRGYSTAQLKASDFPEIKHGIHPN